VGGVSGDGKSGTTAFEEALVAGIGSAGGAWAANLGGGLIKDGVSALARKTLSGTAARRVDAVASKALLPWNKYEGGLLASFGAALAGYEASPQSRPPATPTTTDIGNGGCPIQVANLQMPTPLAPAVDALYRRLPSYLCGVWRDFGAGSPGPVHSPAPPPALPTRPSGVIAAVIDDYERTVTRLNATMAGFAALDRKAADLVNDSAEIATQGKAAVDSLIDIVNRRVHETPGAGTSADEYALQVLNEAFAEGRHILVDAITAGDQLARRTDNLTGQLRTLREDLDAEGRRTTDLTEQLNAMHEQLGAQDNRAPAAHIARPQPIVMVAPRPVQPVPIMIDTRTADLATHARQSVQPRAADIPHRSLSPWRPPADATLATASPSDFPQLTAAPHASTPWTESCPLSPVAAPFRPPTSPAPVDPSPREAGVPARRIASENISTAGQLRVAPPPSPQYRPSDPLLHTPWTQSPATAPAGTDIRLIAIASLLRATTEHCDDATTSPLPAER
jgi:hypothetical protein